MPISQRDASNTLRTVSAISMRDASNTLRTITAVMQRDASNVLRTVFSSGGSGGGGGSGSLTMTPANVTRVKGTTSGGAQTLVSPAATVSGATGSPTYSWAKVSGATMTVTNPGMAFTSFSASVNVDQQLSAVYACTVVDGSGTHTLNVNVSLELVSTS